MRRAVARGRIVPQSLSTDPRMGRVSLKAALLFPLMWINCDDQGRLSGDPDEVKYAACPNIDHITKADIPELLNELETQGFIKVYTTSKTKAMQMLDWWEVQRLQWAWPSQFSAMEAWVDHLRYKKDAKTVVTQSWPVSGEVSGEVLGDRSGEQASKRFHLPKEEEKEEEKERGKRKRRGRGRGKSPEGSGERTSPSLVDNQLLDIFYSEFPYSFGRDPDSRESAQLRDLGIEISSAGGATESQVKDAYKEAAMQNKFSISYVRAILHSWLGMGRGPP